MIEPRDMAIYEWRGARKLSVASYKGKCFQCAWATIMAVEIEYIWGVNKKYCFERNQSPANYINGVSHVLCCTKAPGQPMTKDG